MLCHIESSVNTGSSAFADDDRRSSNHERVNQLDFAFATVALIGTSSTPRPSAAFAHLATRSIETGRALAYPTARPRSRAIVSSRLSARSMSTAVGTASSATSALAKERLLAPAIWLARLRAEV